MVGPVSRPRVLLLRPLPIGFFVLLIESSVRLIVVSFLFPHLRNLRNLRTSSPPIFVPTRILAQRPASA